MTPLIMAAAALIEMQHYEISSLKDALYICAAIDGQGKIVNYDILQMPSDDTKRDTLLQRAHDPALRVDAPANYDPNHIYSGNKFQTPIKITEHGAEPITGRVCHLRPVI